MRMVLVAATLLCGASAIGQTVIGVPGCRSWVAKAEIARATWLVGYLSGMNVVNMGTGGSKIDSLKGVTFKEVTDWMYTYCKASPNSNVQVGANIFFAGMEKQADESHK